MNPERKKGFQGVGGFSLIEILMVILIMAILATLVIGLVPFAKRKMMESRARSDLQVIRTALTEYKLKHGTYPTGVTMVADRLESGVLLTDPWENPYDYTYDPTKPGTYSLYSWGPDGTNGTADDISK